MYNFRVDNSFSGSTVGSVMEQNKNIFPEFHLFPRVERVVHFMFDHIRHEGISSHRNTGAAPLLDSHMDNEQLQFLLMTENIAAAGDYE